MKSLIPDCIAPPFARYSHGVEIRSAARLVRTSGQLGWDVNGKIPVSPFEQARNCFNNILAILLEADMDETHICHVSSYVTNREYMADYMKARDLFFAERPDENLPSSTLVIVSGFSRPEFKVEVEVWACAD
ncbi:MAG: RidA family protein [Aestuariivita sp.]|nr:RidA family protein [Aestuariivita sp.]